MKQAQVHELLYQALETEMGVYRCIKPPSNAP